VGGWAAARQKYGGSANFERLVDRLQRFYALLDKAVSEMEITYAAPHLPPTGQDGLRVLLFPEAWRSANLHTGLLHF